VGRYGSGEMKKPMNTILVIIMLISLLTMENKDLAKAMLVLILWLEIFCDNFFRMGA
jgi:hypothetical protein